MKAARPWSSARAFAFAHGPRGTALGAAQLPAGAYRAVWIFARGETGDGSLRRAHLHVGESTPLRCTRFGCALSRYRACGLERAAADFPGSRAMAVEHIVVVGAGQMGAGIAQVALTAGLRVTLMDVCKPRGSTKGVERIQAGLASSKEKGKLDEGEVQGRADSRLGPPPTLAAR